jgi:hypothetical protein
MFGGSVFGSPVGGGGWNSDGGAATGPGAGPGGAGGAIVGCAEAGGGVPVDCGPLGAGDVQLVAGVAAAPLQLHAGAAQELAAQQFAVQQFDWHSHRQRQQRRANASGETANHSPIASGRTVSSFRMIEIPL